MLKEYTINNDVFSGTPHTRDNNVLKIKTRGRYQSNKITKITSGVDVLSFVVSVRCNHQTYGSHS
jgi:hypothetical protein